MHWSTTNLEDSAFFLAIRAWFRSSLVGLDDQRGSRAIRAAHCIPVFAMNPRTRIVSRPLGNTTSGIWSLLMVLFHRNRRRLANLFENSRNAGSGRQNR